jgi:hypothetical protein
MTHDRAHCHWTHHWAHLTVTHGWAHVSGTHSWAYQPIPYIGAHLNMTHGRAHQHSYQFGPSEFWCISNVNTVILYKLMTWSISMDMFVIIVSGSLISHTADITVTQKYTQSIQHIQNTGSQCFLRCHAGCFDCYAKYALSLYSTFSKQPCMCHTSQLESYGKISPEPIQHIQNTGPHSFGVGRTGQPIWSRPIQYFRGIGRRCDCVNLAGTTNSRIRPIQCLWTIGPHFTMLHAKMPLALPVFMEHRPIRCRRFPNTIAPPLQL